MTLKIHKDKPMPRNIQFKTTPAMLLGLALILSCFAFAGCGLNPGPAPPAYTLNPTLPPPDQSEPRLNGKIQLGINMPLIDEALDNNRVALLINNREYRYWKDATWTARVPELVQRWLIASFESDGRIFVSADDVDGFLADYRLGSYIREFNIIAGDNGTYAAAFAITSRLVDLRDGKVIAVFNRRYEQPAAGSDLASIMTAFDKITGQGLGDLADWAVDSLNARR